MHYRFGIAKVALVFRILHQSRHCVSTRSSGLALQLGDFGIVTGGGRDLGYELLVALGDLDELPPENVQIASVRIAVGGRVAQSSGVV